MKSVETDFKASDLDGGCERRRPRACGERVCVRESVLRGDCVLFKVNEACWFWARGERVDGCVRTFVGV